MFREITLGEARKLPGLKAQIAGMERWPDLEKINVPVATLEAPPDAEQVIDAERETQE